MVFGFIKKFFFKSSQTNMEKEILEQPETINKLIKKYIDKKGVIIVI